ncbi:MAG: hypothetical protein M3Z37_07930 [Candidatus Eremiobacteraeota bacterium]|nr:hypothetical protein [Candidatus Eremiobacteraeota bacterium]
MVDHVGDAARFVAAHMIKLQNPHISLRAVDARVIKKKCVDELSPFTPSNFLTSIAANIMDLLEAAVV